jgi:hypothetical protein
MTNSNNNENNESENPVILEELQIWKNLIWENFSFVIEHFDKKYVLATLTTNFTLQGLPIK